MGSTTRKMLDYEYGVDHGENPLVAALVRAGCDAHVGGQKTGRENRAEGDICVTVGTCNPPDERKYWIESQIAKAENSNFSWSASKVDGFGGDFVYLRCSDRPDFLHFILHADDLRGLLTDGVERDGITLMTGKNGPDWWLIKPFGLVVALRSISAPKFYGDDLDKVVKEFVDYLSHTSPEPRQKHI